MPVTELETVATPGTVASEEARASHPEAQRRLPALYGDFLTEGRAEARARFLKELRQSVTDLQNLLAVDDTKRSHASPDKLAAALGADAARFLSVEGLMAAFGRRSARPAGMESVRRERCEAALGTLEQGLRRQLESPAFLLFDSGPDPCAEALDRCGRQLLEAEPVLRALRIAKLEAVSAYDPAHHDEALEHFGWRSADPHEIAALSVHIAVESAERLSLDSLSRLLLSGQPAQVLVTRDFHVPAADLGAIALAYRAAFVAQTSLTQSDHLSKTFAEMARTLHPAIAVVELSASPKEVPLYRYDPDRPGAWTDRFDLENESPECGMISALAATTPVAPAHAAPVQDLTAIREQAAKDAYMSVIALLADPASLIRPR